MRIAPRGVCVWMLVVVSCGAAAQQVGAQSFRIPQFAPPPPPPFQQRQYYPQRPTHQPNPGADVGRFLEGLIKEGTRNLENNNRRRDDYWEPQYQNQGERRYSQPTRTEVRPNTVTKPNAVVKKNAPPKVKPTPTTPKPNAISAAKPATAALLNSTSGQIKAATADRIDRIGEDLAILDPGLANEPGVKQALDDLKTKNESGLPITQSDLDKVRTAVENAANGLPMPLSGDEKATMSVIIERNAGAIDQLSSLQTQLQSSTAGDGWIVYNPALPPGTAVILPSGAVMAGGGGYATLTLQQGSVSQALGLPVSDGPPLPDAPTPGDIAADTAGGEVVLFNPTESACHYVLNDQYNYTMAPGREQRLAADRKWMIKFDRGNGNASSEAVYSLPAGFYQFAMKDGGWDLVPKMNQLTIDNRDNPNAFEYVLDNVNCVVEASSTRDHRSASPMSIRFDRGGNGQIAEKRVDGDKTTLRVAVDSKDQLWNLYPVGGTELTAFE